MSKVLVTGGAGYIGSHAVLTLAEAGHSVVVLDDLSRGHARAVDGFPLVKADIGDRAALRGLFDANAIDAVMHFAARCYVDESVADPASYWLTNLAGSIALLDAAREAGVRDFVFSSSCAVYGEPGTATIPEDAPSLPINPYGRTKAAFEAVLADYARAYGTRWVSLRYFNAAGATRALGEDHHPETHIIPLVVDAALGRRGPVRIYGTDYPTPDGTAVRDYVHVADLAHAHVLALARMDLASGRAYNLGTGAGASVRAVVYAAERVTGLRVPVEEAPRRPGDPAALVAAQGRALGDLGWQPAASALDAIIDGVHAWRRDHPEGYGRD